MIAKYIYAKIQICQNVTIVVALCCLNILFLSRHNAVLIHKIRLVRVRKTSWFGLKWPTCFGYHKKDEDGPPSCTYSQLWSPKKWLKISRHWWTAGICFQALWLVTTLTLTLTTFGKNVNLGRICGFAETAYCSHYIRATGRWKMSDLTTLKKIWKKSWIRPFNQLRTKG